MAPRDPHQILGIEAGASQTTIKAAWRRLAREHHPDLTGGDPATVRRATRVMAEINAAYEKLRSGHGRGPGAASPRFDEEGATPGGARTAEQRADRAARSAQPRRARPVTGRVDTSGTFRPRNATTSAARPILRGTGGRRADRAPRETPRASTPTGPLERDRLRQFRRPPPPPLASARDVVVEFGKFRGHTLGEIAAFEPAYVDWLARTISRDPELVAAARVVQADLDERHVLRPDRSPAATGQRRSAV